MKTIAANLKSAIADDGTVATCVRITRTDGGIVGFTDHDIPLTVNAVTYKPLPALERIVMKLRNNAEVSNQDFAGTFVVELDEQDLFNGIYNEAKFDVIYVNWRDPSMGSITVFSGRMGNIQWNNDGFAVDVFNLVHTIDGAIGNVITGKCRHQLFSQEGDKAGMIGACGLSSVAYTNVGAVTTVDVQKLTFEFNGFVPGADYMANGILTWTSGLNAGTKYEVKSNTINRISLFLPTDFVIEVGDTFSVTAGCDKTIGTCGSKFNNVLNFGGIPIKGVD